MFKVRSLRWSSPKRTTLEHLADQGIAQEWRARHHTYQIIVSTAFHTTNFLERHPGLFSGKIKKFLFGSERFLLGRLLKV